ncbi:tyrosine-type recombinase/integrase [Mesorhizobium sp. ES1-1]|uniref:tyrosine-type recombinase/integrase n=1 Tax=Mesorhizobium sp. ES1-1 TaxID=2876629 RepID=UPI001CCAA6A7|nr:site-specific integrase [Mesorhizobium sp. ES1-1]MBZ9678229.1 site-specific integrase [Mesorhizobium sp. ES1-1]
MSIRKRTWTTSKGEAKTSWVVDYVDGKGTRRLKTFAKKKEADQFAATAKVEVREGVHVADSASATVTKAAEGWLTHCADKGLERGTLVQYRQLKALHVDPYIGAEKLTSLTVARIRSFETDLREAGRSASMIRKVLVALSSILADAQESGLVGRNVARDMKARRSKGGERRQERRHRGRLTVGADIPAPEEIKAIVGALAGRWRPLLLTAIFTGLRASELRGLRWVDVDLDRRSVHVRQRADRFNEIGPPKSEAGEREVPLPPIVVNTLREWKLVCPRRDTGKVDVAGEPITALDLVFPNLRGNVEAVGNIVRRGLQPAQVKAGVTIDTGKVNDKGEPILAAKYPGLHALRHFYASWCINRPADGGLGLPIKVVQERLGHSSIILTSDRYGHLFPRGDDEAEMAAAERSLLS